MKKMYSIVLSGLLILPSGTAWAETAGIDMVSSKDALSTTTAAVSPTDQSEVNSTFIVDGYIQAVDKEAYLANLDQDQMELFKSAIEVSSVGESFIPSQASPSKVSFAVVSPSCYTGTGYRWGLNVYGATLWKMAVKGTWCGLFDKVTSASVTSVYPVETGLFWTAGGLLEKGSTIWSNSARIYGQYQFNLNLAGWNAQSVYPCIRLTGYVSGNYGSSSLCGPY
jgi:hypothetical protein